MNITSKQRAYLKSLANGIDPIFQVGKASLTPELVNAVDEALEKREIIKLVLTTQMRLQTQWLGAQGLE